MHHQSTWMRRFCMHWARSDAGLDRYVMVRFEIILEWCWRELAEKVRVQRIPDFHWKPRRWLWFIEMRNNGKATIWEWRSMNWLWTCYIWRTKTSKEALGYACLHSCSQPHTSLYPLHHSLKSFHWPPGTPILWSVNPHPVPPLVFLIPVNGVSTLNSWPPCRSHLLSPQAPPTCQLLKSKSWSYHRLLFLSTSYILHSRKSSSFP